MGVGRRGRGFGGVIAGECCQEGGIRDLLARRRGPWWPTTACKADGRAVRHGGPTTTAALLDPVGPQRIGFEELAAATGSSSTQEMEGVVVSDCLGPGLVVGRLDHASSCLVAESCQPRDVAPEELPAVAAALRAW